MLWNRHVCAAEDGTRLDAFVGTHKSEWSRSDVRDAISEGRVRVDGKPRPKGFRVSTDQLISIDPKKIESDENSALDLVHVEDDWVVVAKKAGLPCHRVRHQEREALADQLTHHFPEMKGIGYSSREAGLVHRLDIWTSGLLIAARTPKAFSRLREGLQSGDWEKRYFALCEGRIGSKPRWIDYPIDATGKRVIACRSEAQARQKNAQGAYTEIVSRIVGHARSLLELRATTACRHQIRVHLAAIGLPLVGDSLYGRDRESCSPKSNEGESHHLLHASLLEFTDPVSGARRRFFHSPCDRFEAALEQETAIAEGLRSLKPQYGFTEAVVNAAPG